MKLFRACSLAVLIACFLMFVAAARSQSAVASRTRMSARSQGPAEPASPRASSSPDNTTAQISEGERLFHVHCGRCHNPPEDLSPREARAVVRQMRVRANLTAKDERALLKFLAP